MFIQPRNWARVGAAVRGYRRLGLQPISRRGNRKRNYGQSTGFQDVSAIAGWAGVGNWRHRSTSDWQKNCLGEKIAQPKPGSLAWCRSRGPQKEFGKRKGELVRKLSATWWVSPT